MAGQDRWWRGDARERFWLEATRRTDIGLDLKAPVGNDGSDKAWRYELFKEAEPGDLVFHYDGNVGAITSVSRIAGPWARRPIVWAARGTYARNRGAVPTEMDGYFVPIHQHSRLATPLSLGMMQAHNQILRDVTASLRQQHKGALYFPFELSARPVRPLQGYAFKLPAAMVAAFPELRAALQEDELGWLTGDLTSGTIGTDVSSLAAAMNSQASGRPIGSLQGLRRKIRGQLRTKTGQIFSPDSIMPDYAFHSGGRDELQFNIGFDRFADGTDAMRAGVAFSLETSRSLPTIDPLVPKIRRFNDFLRAHPEAFPGVAMWHRHGQDRSDDYPPSPIAPDVATEGRFIFLGVRQPRSRTDVGACLDAFDLLLPLWRYVELGDSADSRPAEPADVGLQLDKGRLSKPGRWATASFTERHLNIELRHNAIQERLRDILHQRHGEGCVRLEPPVVGRYVDAVLTLPSGLTFYEVKTADTVRQCLREALGQLLDYALWPGATRPERLVVVGEATMDEASANYLARLNAGFPVPIEYEAVPLS